MKPRKKESMGQVVAKEGGIILIIYAQKEKG